MLVLWLYCCSQREILVTVEPSPGGILTVRPREEKPHKLLGNRPPITWRMVIEDQATSAVGSQGQNSTQGENDRHRFRLIQCLLKLPRHTGDCLARWASFQWTHATKAAHLQGRDYREGLEALGASRWTRKPFNTVLQWTSTQQWYTALICLVAFN